MNYNELYKTACINRGIKEIAIQMQQQPSEGARMNVTPCLAIGHNILT